MNAQQLIREHLLKQLRSDEELMDEIRIDGYDVDSDESLTDTDDWLDALEEFRSSGEPTDIEAPCSRHYEARSVAKEIDGVWVGWTYWYGGGKHGDPEAIEWLADAYFVECAQETKLVTVKTFTRKER